jgi:hypothetical protein
MLTVRGWLDVWPGHLCFDLAREIRDWPHRIDHSPMMTAAIRLAVCCL